MGYIEIPKIKVNLPIYHGTDEAILQIAIGHIQGSSLPAGGSNTYVVLSGHRGLPSATLFTHLDRMKEGDKFELHVLVTCTPYRVNTHRLLVRGHRVANEESGKVDADAPQVDPMNVSFVIGLIALILILFWMIISYQRRRWRLKRGLPVKERRWKRKRKTKAVEKKEEKANESDDH